MGASGSKAAKTAAGAAQRKYPSRPSAATIAQSGSSGTSAPPTPVMPSDTSGPGAGPEPRGTARSRPQPRVSPSRDAGIDMDGRDPHLAGNLRSLGPVQPAPTFSPSSVSASTADSGHPARPSPRNNPALAILAARTRLEEQIEEDRGLQGRKGWQGRRFLDVTMIRRALVLRDEQGMPEAEVERTMGLRPGTVRALGEQGVVEAA